MSGRRIAVAGLAITLVTSAALSAELAQSGSIGPKIIDKKTASHLETVRNTSSMEVDLLELSVTAESQGFRFISKKSSTWDPGVCKGC